MSDFDWVTARNDCSVIKAFVQLKKDLARDVDIANSLFKESRRKFSINQDANSISVIEETAATLRSISFVLGDTRTTISIEDEKGNQKFSATVTLNKDKQCVFMVDSEEMESWQLRKKGVGPLFFSIPVAAADGFKAL